MYKGNVARKEGRRMRDEKDYEQRKLRASLEEEEEEEGTAGDSFHTGAPAQMGGRETEVETSGRRKRGGRRGRLGVGAEGAA